MKNMRGDNMPEIIERLILIEEMAERVYEKARIVFKGDWALSDLLKDLALDERVHKEILSRALEETKGPELPELKAYLDHNTEAEIMESFRLCEKRLDENSCTKDEIVGFIVRVEFSEWNDMFMYVMYALKRISVGFSMPAVRIQQHKRRIEKYLDGEKGLRHYLKDIDKLPDIWEEKILVVDDDETVSDVLKALLADDGAVETASNGYEGLKKISSKYYAAIVTDFEMPQMDGVEFYKNSTETYPNIKDRFLFFTGSFDPELLEFFMENKIKHIKKPASIRAIRAAVRDILLSR